MPRLKKRNAHYRHARILLQDDTEYPENLETLYRRAMGSDEIQQPITKGFGISGDVTLAFGTDANGDSVFNSHTCACGWLSIYTQDRKVPTVTVDNNGVRTSECEPTDADGRPNNWEEDSLIFAIKGNHVALFISVRGRVDRLEDMLNWLFVNRLHLLPEGSRLYFENPLNQSIEERIRTCNIKEIELKASSLSSGSAVAPEVSTDWVPGTCTGLLYSIVDVFRDRIPVTGSHRFSSGLESSEAIVPPMSLKMNFKAHYASIDEAQTTMRLLADGTDGVENLKVRFYMEDNTKIEGDELTIKEKLDVEFENGNIVKERAMNSLAAWLTSMRDEGIIPL